MSDSLVVCQLVGFTKETFIMACIHNNLHVNIGVANCNNNNYTYFRDKSIPHDIKMMRDRFLWCFRFADQLSEV